MTIAHNKWLSAKEDSRISRIHENRDFSGQRKNASTSCGKVGFLKGTGFSPYVIALQ